MTNSINKVLALALMFWWAGAGCMMVSYARNADTEAASAETASQPADQMAAVPACHAHKTKAPKAPKSSAAKAERVGQLTLPTPLRSGAMSCCPFTTGSIAAASRPQTDSSAPELAHTVSQLPNLIYSTPAPIAVPLRLPNRAHSYLLDCAFLI